MKKFYYIDGSFFEDSQRSREYLHRFIKHLQRNRIEMILVSIKEKDNPIFEKFKERYHSVPIIYCSTNNGMEIAMNNIQGVLQLDCVDLVDYGKFYPMSGSCVEFDASEKKARRIHFNVFANYHEEDSYDFLVDELENMIFDKLSKMKKNKPKVC